MKVSYQLEPALTPAEFIDVLERSTLAERQPVHDANRVQAMLAHADIWRNCARVGRKFYQKRLRKRFALLPCPNWIEQPTA